MSMRYPTTIEEALADTLEALTDPTITVVPTHALFIEMLEILVRLKHS